MGISADAVGAVVQGPGLGLRQRDQLLDVLHRKRRVDHQHRGNTAQHDDGREVLDRIVRKLAEEMRIGGDGGVGRDQERQPVRRRFRHRLRSDGIIAARTVIDDDRLPPRLGQSLGHDTGHGVGHAAGRNRDDQLDRSARIALRVRGAACSREQQGGEQDRRRTRHRPSPSDLRRGISCPSFAAREKIDQRAALRQSGKPHAVAAKRGPQSPAISVK